MPRAVTVSPFEVSAPSGVDQRFPGACRLRKTDEYSSVFAFRRAFKGRYFIAHYRPNDLGSARLGVVIAKKLAKRANVRNLLKRIVREQFRKMRSALTHHDLVVRLHSPVDGATRGMLNADVAGLLGRFRA